MEKLTQKVRECSGELLDLSCYPIRDDESSVVCNEIKHNTSLRNIWFTCNYISDLTPLAKVLRSNSALEKLCLNNNQISNITPLEGALCYNSSLKSLYLGFNRISDITPIVGVLKHNTSLVYLDLRHNEISDVTPIIELLQSNSSLEEIWLYGNLMSKHDLVMVEQMLYINRYNAPLRRTTLFEMMLASGVLQ